LSSIKPKKALMSPAAAHLYVIGPTLWRSGTVMGDQDRMADLFQLP
jgi:hypothetical protein